MLPIRGGIDLEKKMTLRHLVSDSCKAERKGFSAIAKTMLIYGIISILLYGLVLSSPVLAGTETDSFAKALVSPDNVSPDDIVLDISPSATRFMEGAVNINYEDFMGEGGQLKSVAEIATLLGEAGISSNDSLVIAGECLPCGGGPSPAIFSYWLLKYLGHERVRVLSGSMDDWAAAGLKHQQ